MRPLRRRGLLADRPVAPPAGVRAAGHRREDRPGLRRAAPQSTRSHAGGAQLERHFDYRDWSPNSRSARSPSVRRRFGHPTPAYATRVTETATGAVLVYSGDTGPNPALVELARGADLLLIESAFRDHPDNAPDLHLSGRQAAEIAAEAGVGSVLITHIPPWHDRAEVLAEAEPHFAGPLTTGGVRRAAGGSSPVRFGR